MFHYNLSTVVFKAKWHDDLIVEIVRFGILIWDLKTTNNRKNELERLFVALLIFVQFTYFSKYV